MNNFVTDTHALIWHLTNNKNLTVKARKIFKGADSGNYQILVPVIILVEMVYLVEKKRIDSSAFDKILALLQSDEGNYRIAPIDLETIKTL